MTAIRLTAKRKAEIKQLIGHDVTFHSDGTFTVKQGYFYCHGRSPDTLAAEVLAAIPDAEIMAKGDHWRAWPKGSYFRVKVCLAEKETR